MKNETLKKREKIANNVMNYIYKYIDTNIDMDDLCYELQISKFHLHRVFKEAFGKNIYETIKSIRLQKASNLLITNNNSTITAVANMCGYSSQTSFIRAFKQRFNMTPNRWRQNGYKTYSNEILKASQSTLSSEASFLNLEPKIVKMPKMKGYYIRHKGYDKSIRKTWEKLNIWTLSNNIKHFQQMGLHHDNPIVTPLNECQYIAAIILGEDEKEPPNSSLPTFILQEGIYAKFKVEGKYGDVLKLIQWVYQDWLIKSGYETTTHPSYAIYEKNHFIEDDGKFILDYYVPITFY
ncbi:MAG: AraC family transcriptional regulator [Candidatus Marinarcus sp.]|uniref:AraC family transcriptional regulator n=1 Tax=Candidatus Marinarcus sp. TaxID=3100987 RepID=UPI003B008394